MAPITFSSPLQPNQRLIRKAIARQLRLAHPTRSLNGRIYARTSMAVHSHTTKDTLHARLISLREEKHALFLMLKKRMEHKRESAIQYH
ncbi:hypothetical protein PHYBLDRAFT_150405 [Phycomyces blakesleeanus NRRL 1555(-)]|uniref:Uncharacterized protein n=1 Tax=Phycomyces blakesleeanus (strain ATCC 8743b / DSM 1359 / FGSC 10004 / NBRC 33097 / NRRL 1555) TaxID=763407 RepID=A0A162ZPD8_PHYB8|nr:hypothetical protein PHYBLDRAFT_150405 [Phycomyces blakesleeanus NRRL 1555(-)]OAD68221.1 hypothetical protein PHYBLDRAFT_150405 [Phycomyces blakesleeanus NRRL 1555(-)]|eukprot:XP_018286261.1 hypothetical protein PHYBLDRAFT_150405 [Phycomyces blakesleeanus NRRL 1555(-)]